MTRPASIALALIVLALVSVLAVRGGPQALGGNNALSVC